MATLPILSVLDPAVSLLETQWSAILNPVINNDLIKGLQLNNILLKTGANTFNHNLGRLQLGWWITDQNASSAIYRSLPFNTQTLTLTSSAPVTVNLWVF